MNKTVLVSVALYLGVAMVYVVGDIPTRSTIVDLWMFSHIGFGVFAAHVVKKAGWFDTGAFWRHAAAALPILLGWEVYEVLQETGYVFHAAIRFHGGMEHPIDRLVVDPLMGLIGILWYRKMPRVFWFTSMACVAWWAINIYLGRVDGVERIIRSWF